MSHFAVAVILKDINDLEKALAPYQENNMGNCPKEYMEFTSVTEECKNDYANENEATKIKYPTLKEYIEQYCCYKFDEEKKDFGYWENPNAKWDYWTLCAKGNWARYQNEKIPLGYCKLKDLDKSFNEKQYNEAIREWELIVEEQPLKKGEKQPFPFYKKEYYIKRYENKETYATIQATPHYWAFVLEGKWYEKGEMGWFCVSDTTKSSEAIYLEKWKEVINDPQYQDYYIAVVDCHI